MMSKKEQYEILKTDGTKEVVAGEVINKIWGMDKRMADDGTIIGYMVTHIPSGAHVPLAITRTLKSAKLILQEPEFFEPKVDPQHIANAVGRFWNQRDWKD